jgi:hypothetical protein
MIIEYKNQVEAMLMQDDVEEGLGLTNVIFTGRAVLAEGGTQLFLETEITDKADVTITHWIALDDKRGLIFEDAQPDGWHKNLPGI